uniref:Uncharacterized protein n=1 Tax=Arundo donax TaxID=35708 RepID=A0A0A9CTW8_ARUDO
MASRTPAARRRKRLTSRRPTRGGAHRARPPPGRGSGARGRGGAWLLRRRAGSGTSSGAAEAG